MLIVPLIRIAGGTISPICSADWCDDNFKGLHALYYFIINDSDIGTIPGLTG